MKPWERYQKAPEAAKPWEKYQQAPEVMEAPQKIPQEEGLGRTALEQGIQGATFGFGDEIADRLGAGIASLATDDAYSDLLNEARQERVARSERQFEQHPGTAILSNIGGALLTGGAGATTKAGGVLGKALTSGGVPARIAKGATAGAASGGVYGAGQAQEDERLQGAKEGAVGGAVLGGVAPAVGAAIRGAVLPKVEGVKQELAKRAKDLGIPLSIEQIAPTRFRKTVQKVSQELPFSGTEGFEGAQRKAFTKAVAKTIGQKSDSLTPETIRKFKFDADKKFGDALMGAKIDISNADKTKLANISTEAESTLGSDLLSIVKKNVDRTTSDISTKGLQGAKLANIRGELLKKAGKAQGESRQYLGDIAEVIHDIAERSVTPKKAKILKQARREWRNFKTIEPLLEKSTDGSINPTDLLGKVGSSRYIKSSTSSVGQDDLVDLARIGKEFLPKTGGSDTFQKSALGAGAIGTIFEPTTGAIIGGGLGANRALQALNRSQARVGKAIEKSGKRLTPQSILPAVLSGQAGANTKNKKKSKVK